MNRGTLMAVVIAAGSAALAVSMAPKDLPPPSFEDTGTPLFPGFTDPTVATKLEVATWDESGAAVKQFSVELKNGKWVIPSHHDYPADATERMGKAAASFVDVKRDLFYSDKVEDHAAFGVLAPDDASGKGEERGQRITIHDESGGVLVDVIVGKDVEGKEGFKYVRVLTDNPKRVYGSRLALDISTAFADWIEKDLLHLEKDKVKTIVYDPYSVDEKTGRVVGTSPVRADLQKVEKNGTSRDDWVLADKVKVPAGKEFDSAKFRQVLGAADRVQIVGIRPRPRQLTLQALQPKGFFYNGRLFGNEGELSLIADDGVVTQLFFGEVTYESGLALTAGGDSKKKDGDEETTETGSGNRYLFVNVGYDPTFDKTEEVAEAEDGKPAIPAGKKRAAELARRFDAWFYVVSDTSFKQLHHPRESLFKDVKKK